MLVRFPITRNSLLLISSPITSNQILDLPYIMTRTKISNADCSVARKDKLSDCWGLAIISLALVLGLVSPLRAHPFHTSTAELELNPKSGRVEVSMRVQTSDLEAALQRFRSAERLESKSEGRLEGNKRDTATEPRDNTESTIANWTAIESIQDRTLAKYLHSVFFITATTQLDQNDIQRDCRFHWVGKELEKSSTTVYFELEIPRSGRALLLTNRVFFEINVGQINTNVIVLPNIRRSLRTDSSHASIELPALTTKP